MAGREGKGLSIFYRFLGTFLATIVFVSSILLGVFYVYSKNAIEKQTQERITQHFESLRHQFETNIKDKLVRDLNILSSNPLLDSYLMATTLQREIDARAVESLFLKSINYTESHRSITYIDYSGQELIKADLHGRVRSYKNIGATVFFKKLESSPNGAIVFAGPYLSDDQEYCLAVGIAKDDPDIGRFGGVVVIEYSLTDFFAQLENIRISGENLVWVFSPDGQPLRHPSSNRKIFDPSPYFADIFQGSARSIIIGDGMVLYQDLGVVPGEPLLRMAITIPTSLLLQDIKSIVNFLLIASLLAILLVSIVVYFVSGYMSKPIVELARAAVRLSKGDISTRVNIKSSGEVQLLVDSFNQMAQDLQKTTVSKDYVDNIIKSMMDMMIVLGPDRTITRANAAACSRLGYAEEELVGHDMTTIYSGDDLDKLFAQESIANQEKIYRAADGSHMTVLLSGATLRDSEKNLQGWVFVAQDISERKLAEQALADRTMELSRSNAELQQFANIASHDLQEPLRKVLAFGDRLADKYGDRLDERGLDYLQRMQGASLRMRHFIEDLLSFSRVTTKAKPFKEVDLNVLLKEVLQNLEIRIEESGGRIEIGELATIEADGFQIQQLFQNLIANALKFAQKDGTPLVKLNGEYLKEVNNKGYAAQAASYYQITVEDNGIGFEEIYKEKIFGVFQRLHGKDEYEGTGIGLSVCQKIVERHKGMISATGMPGKGAKFTVILPVVQNSAGQVQQ